MNTSSAVQFAPAFIKKVDAKARAAARKVIAREVAKEAARLVRKALEDRLENALADTGATDPASLLAAAEAEATLVLSQLTDLVMPPVQAAPPEAEARPAISPHATAPAPFPPLAASLGGSVPSPAPSLVPDGRPAPFEPWKMPGVGLTAAVTGFVPAPYSPPDSEKGRSGLATA